MVSSVDKAVVDRYDAFVEVTVLPAETNDLPNAPTCTKEHGEQWKPVTVLLRVGDVVYKASCSATVNACRFGFSQL